MFIGEIYMTKMGGQIRLPGKTPLSAPNPRKNRGTLENRTVGIIQTDSKTRCHAVGCQEDPPKLGGTAP